MRELTRSAKRRRPRSPPSLWRRGDAAALFRVGRRPIGIVGGSIVAGRRLSLSPLAYDAEVLQRSNITRRSILKREEQVFDQPAPIDNELSNDQ